MRKLLLLTLALLSVSLCARAQGGAVTSGPQSTLQRGSGQVRVNPDGTVSVRTNGADRMTVDAAGNIFSAPTWNSLSTVFTALRLNATDTNSNANSLLFDFQVGGASKVRADKSGNVTAASVMTTGGGYTNFPAQTDSTGAAGDIWRNGANFKFYDGAAIRTFFHTGSTIPAANLQPGAANQVLGTNGAGTAPEYKTLVAGSGVTITHTPNTITISASGGATTSTVNAEAPPYYAIASTQTTTGTINSGSHSLTVASPVDFGVGHGIYIAGAGPGAAALVTKVDALSGTTFTLHDAASTTVVGVTVQHDNTSAINQAIADVIARGGGTVDLPAVGTYLVNGRLDPVTNSVITFPQVPYSTLGPIIPIRIRGALPPPFAADYKGVLNGTIIQSTVAGSGTVPAVIATAPWSAFVGGPAESNLKNYIVPTLENLIIRTYDNPSIAAVNFAKAIGAQLVCVDIDEGIASQYVSNPTTDLAGVYMPQAENYGLSYLSRVSVTGYRNGVYASDHAHFDEILMERNYTGVLFDDAAATVYGVIDSYFNKEAIRFKGSNGSNVDLVIHHERNDGSFAGKWYDAVSPEFVAETPGVVAGKIEFRITGHAAGEGLADAAEATTVNLSRVTMWNLGKSYTLGGVATYSDNFNRPNGAIGSNWLALTGTPFLINGNQADLGSTAGDSAMRFLSAGTPTNPLITLKPTIDATNDTSIGVIIHEQDANNEELLDFSRGGTALLKKVGGSYLTEQQDVTHHLTPGTQNTVTITVSGLSYTININGTTFTLTSDGTITGAGGVGLRNGGPDTGTRLVDDFTVTY